MEVKKIPNMINLIANFHDLSCVYYIQFVLLINHAYLININHHNHPMYITLTFEGIGISHDTEWD